MTNDDRSVKSTDEWRWANEEELRSVSRDFYRAVGGLPPRADSVLLRIKRLHPDAKLPQYATAGAAGFDLCAVEDVIIEPGETKKVPLGLAFEIPQGYELQIRMRSGIAAKTKLRLPNGVGTIDSDYRGEVSMMFDNISIDKWSNASRRLDNSYDESTRGKTSGYIIRKGDRVCQGVLQRVPQAEFLEVDELSASERGAGGFGSTGIKAKEDD